MYMGLRMAKKSHKGVSTKSWLKKLAKEDPVREQRIIYEIVVDAYNEDERNLGWYYYLEGALVFPFKATCIDERQVSPLTVGDKVEVVGLADEDECRAEMLVLVEWEDEDEELAVPLAQLHVARGKGQTVQAVEDWHYWLARGYQF
jgi:hypothetical protein